MRKTTRILSIVLVLLMLVGLMPSTALADRDVGARVTYADGRTEDCSTFPQAWNKATASNNATVTLFNNWDGGRFVVPEDKTVTLELNGWVLTRNLSSGKSDGEVLYVSDNATLNVYGGTKSDPAANADHEHSVWVYRARGDRYDYTRDKITLKGGIINGGHSSDAGGGIHMKESAKVYLYHVTIAGNRASAKTVEFGDGGGIEMDCQYGYVYMEDSQIIYNCARYDGGGIHVDSDYCRVDMVRSRIDHNVADDNGGGIYVDGDHFVLKGDAKQIMDPEAAISTYQIKDWTGAWNYFPDVNALGSSISYNCVFDTEDGGGGIYVDNGGALIEGINFFGNITTDDSGSGTGDGGAVYLDEEEITVRSCNILRNKADKLGGGIYVRGDNSYGNYDDNTVDSCTIYKNLAWATGGAGGGIYVHAICNLSIAGTLIVRGNVSDGLANDNLYLSTDNVMWGDSCLMPSVSAGADVHVRISGSRDDLRITRKGGTYDASLFSYDNDSGKHISWDSAWNDRHLRIVNGAKPTSPSPTVFTPDSGKRTQTLDQEYNGYPIIKGVFSYPEFTNDDADLESIFYYSDGFFAGDTNTYNPQLATASMCLAGAAGYSNEYGKDDRTGGMSSDYLDKSQNFRQFVSDIGCKDEDIFVNNFNVMKPDADTIGVGIASKPIFGTKTLVIIGVRGMGYEKEWISNMSLGASGEAAGWSSAATQVMAELDAYLTRKGIDGTSENTIFWIAGYSRAGATSNLTAKRIVDKYDNNGTHTFAYPLEAPKGGVASEKVDGNNYNCIHNVVNQNDIVPWTGTTEMGFIRYGVDHYIPGSPDTHTPTKGSDNIMKDNAAWNVASNDYNTQKQSMLEQLKAINPRIIFDDYYHLATIEYLNGGTFQTSSLITEINAYSSAVGATTEDFVKNFFVKLQEWAFKYATDGTEVGSPYSNNPRAYFASYPIYSGKTFQQAAAAVAGIIFGMPAEQKEALIGSLNGFLDRMEGKVSFWMHLSGTTTTSLSSTAAHLTDDIKNIWKQLADPDSTAISKGARSIRNFMPEEDFNTFNDSYMSLLFPILCFTAVDYNQNKQALVGTAAYNIPRIIANHYPEVTHSWLRSYDSLYANDGGAPTVMNPDVKTAPSPAALEITHADGTKDTVVPTDNQDITVNIDDVVRLLPSDPGDINVGEAIYYQFLDGPAYTWRDRGPHAFSKPFKLSEMLDTHAWQGTFKFSVTAAHNGVKLKPVTVRLVLEGNAFLSIPMTYSEGDYHYTELPVEIGKSQSIDAITPVPASGMRFKYWEVYAYDPATGTAGDAISPDKYIEYFGTDFHVEDETLTVTNKKGVSARFVPVYEKIVSSIDISFGGGRSFQDEPGMYYLPGYVDWKDSDAAEVEGRSTIFWTLDKTKGEFYATFSITLSGIETFDGMPELDIDSSSLNNYVGNLYYYSVNGTVSGRTLTVTATFDTYLPNEQYNYEWYIDDQAVALYDLNLNQQIGEYHFHNEGTVTAPFVADMEFVHWQDGSTDPETAVTTINMKAYYRPIVNTVEITLNQPLTGGEQLPALNGIKVRVSNNWRLDSGIALAWNSSDAIADYNKVYTARITVNKAELTGTNLSVSGSSSVPLTGAFSFAESLAVTVKDADGNPLTITNYVFTETEDDVILDLVFEQTEKQTIIGFTDVSVTVAHGSSESQILAALPTEVYAYLENGMMVSVPVAWDSADDVDPYDLEAQSVTAYGSYAGSDYTVADGVSLTAAVTVKEVERTAAPAAVPGSGEYTGLKTVVLTADVGAAIRYAISEVALSDYYTETTDPDTGETIIAPNPDLNLTPPEAEDYLEYDEPIVLNEYGKVLLLYAYAEKEGLRDSNVAMFRYELTKPEVMKLEAKDPKIAEDGNIECWYSYKTKDDEVIPEKYYADENCTELLDYSEDVRIPAFISTSHPANETDAVAACVKLYEEEQVIFGGFDTLGVQEIGSDGQAARVLTVLDARIIRDATDYGYLFTASDAEPTYDAAQYKYSCMDTTNTLYGGADYCYVTAKIAGSFLDEDLKACFYVKLENGTDYIYTSAVICTPTISGTGMPDNVEDNITLNITVPKFKSHSLVLSGQIGVNFYMDLPAIDGVDYVESYMTFEISGKGTVSSDPVPYNPAQMNPGHTLYGFSCYVNSIQMADTITATFHYGNGLTISETYSIRQYIESFDTYLAEHPNAFDEMTVNLVHALADYGHYVQLFLAGTKGWTLGTGDDQYAEMDTYYTDSYEFNSIAEALSDYEIMAGNTDPNIRNLSYTLVLDSETTLCMTLKPITGFTGDLYVREDDNAVVTIPLQSKRWMVEIPNIPAHLLGQKYMLDMYTDAASYEGEENNRAWVVVSPMTYALMLLQNGNDAAKDAGAALYAYWQAAKAFKEAN